MGIESDQVVYEYLSRVGDVAQQRQLSSAARMRLVAELREEIDRRRAKAAVDSPAAVRRILNRLGSPDEIVAAASDRAGGGSDGGGASRPPAAPVPVQRDREQLFHPEQDDDGGRARGVLRRVVPRPRPASRPVESPDPAPSDMPSSPHQAGEYELGDAQPDWWRVDTSPFGVGDDVPGFVGGVEIPELLRPPPPKDAVPAAAVEKAEEPAKTEEPEETEPAPRRRRRFVPLPARPAGGWNNPLLLLAAALLVAGAVIGNWFALLFGWVIAYTSRRLTQAEKKGAVFVIPGLAITAGLVWLWGRTEKGWGARVAEGQMNTAVSETWPWVVRGAAVASALFLVWRSQKQR
ncbi:HAAS signaling domain-containing protein [Streptomyces sp. TRM68367]|uniref:HAAS signaling domain-containing protein n=1 Tax=Streptomyces sp. TRM68367 TaxID=2758415 RepID=UPI00165CA036|nr:hypothetical protein [Streptomyces sp. TRM68367]MBC9727194.1 hypothetical protein [Streptomyces sp. TRM68367]